MKNLKLLLALSFVVSSAAVMAEDAVVTPAATETKVEAAAPATTETPKVEAAAPTTTETKVEAADAKAEVKAEAKGMLTTAKEYAVYPFNKGAEYLKKANEGALSLEEKYTPAFVTDAATWVKNNQVTTAAIVTTVAALSYVAYNNVSKKSKN